MRGAETRQGGASYQRKMDQTSISSASGRVWTAAAAVAFLAATAIVYFPVLRDGVTSFSPTEAPVKPWGRVDIADLRYHVYLVNRGARALVSNPLRYFSAQHCYPRKLSLTVGEHLLTMAVLAVPVHLLTGDPELTYNVVLFEMAFLAAFAMFLLVRDWTACPPGAVAAALLYAFHAVHLRNTVHSFAYDTSWWVFAMYFGRRWFAGGRWRDAVGLTIAGVLQTWTSLYPVVGTLLLALPFAAWLLLRYGIRHVRPVQVAFVPAAVVLAAAFVYGPYLAMRNSDVLFPRTARAYAMWSLFLPGGKFFFGWPCLLLALAGVVLRRSAVAPSLGGNPRPALVAGGGLALLAALGPMAPGALSSVVSFDLWTLLSSALPGLDNVRMIFRVYAAAHLATCVLAGLGFAGVFRSLHQFLPRSGPVLAAAGLLVVSWDVLRAWIPATGSQAVFLTYRTEPTMEELRFFDQLRRKGNDGPIFEWPQPSQGARTSDEAARYLTLATYHRRPVSSCYGSYVVDDQLTVIGSALPAPNAFLMLEQAGFTTLLVHHAGGDRDQRLRPFEALADETVGFLRPLGSVSTLTAFQITVAGS